MTRTNYYLGPTHNSDKHRKKPFSLQSREDGSMTIRNSGAFYLFVFLFLAYDFILKVTSWFKMAAGALALTCKFLATGKMGRGG